MANTLYVCGPPYIFHLRARGGARAAVANATPLPEFDYMVLPRDPHKDAHSTRPRP